MSVEDVTIDIRHIPDEVVANEEQKRDEQVPVNAENPEQVERKEDEQTHLCQICFDTHEMSQTYRLSLCTHRFCRECLYSFVKYKVIDGNVYPKCCYYLNNELGIIDTEEEKAKPIFCEADIVHNDCVALLESDLDTMEKYHRFKYCRENKNARECPKCHTFQLGTPERTPKIVCVRCENAYCFFHANAHDFDKYPTCEEYEAALAPALKESEEFIRSTTRKCPGCSKPVSKIGGCNHMKCQCGVAFCWLCGKQIDDALFPAHFQWWNPSGCSNLQMNEANEPTRVARCGARILSILELIVLGPLTLASTLLFSLLCFPCILCYVKAENRTITVREVLSNCMSSWGIFWMLILFALPLCLTVIIIGATLVVSLGIACYPFYAIIRLAMRQYPWPDWVTDCCHDRLASIRWRYRLWRRRRSSRQNSLVNSSSRANSINGNSSPAISRTSSSSSLRRTMMQTPGASTYNPPSYNNNTNGSSNSSATKDHPSTQQQHQQELFTDLESGCMGLDTTMDTQNLGMTIDLDINDLEYHPMDLKSGATTGAGSETAGGDEDEQEKRLSRMMRLLESLENVANVDGHGDLESGEAVIPPLPSTSSS